MTEKPVSGDDEQRRAQTRAAREQSGLAPEMDDADRQEPSRAEPPLPAEQRERGTDRSS